MTSVLTRRDFIEHVTCAGAMLTIARPFDARASVMPAQGGPARDSP